MENFLKFIGLIVLAYLLFLMCDGVVQTSAIVDEYGSKYDIPKEEFFGEKTNKELCEENGGIFLDYFFSIQCFKK